MIRVYYLPLLIIDGTEQVAGIQWIHDALLEDCESPTIMKLTQDTTSEEDDALIALAYSHHHATQEEIDRYHAQVIIIPPDPDISRAAALLSTSPEAITQPEIWELLRIFGRLLGIPE